MIDNALLKFTLRKRARFGPLLLRTGHSKRGQRSADCNTSEPRHLSLRRLIHKMRQRYVLIRHAARIMR